MKTKTQRKLVRAKGLTKMLICLVIKIFKHKNLYKLNLKKQLDFKNMTCQGHLEVLGTPAISLVFAVFC